LLFTLDQFINFFLVSEAFPKGIVPRVERGHIIDEYQGHTKHDRYVFTKVFDEECDDCKTNCVCQTAGHQIPGHVQH